MSMRLISLHKHTKVVFALLNHLLLHTLLCTYLLPPLVIVNFSHEQTAEIVEAKPIDLPDI